MFEAQDCLSSSDVVQNYNLSARNLMVIARMPEDCSKTFNHVQKPSKTFKAIYTFKNIQKPTNTKGDRERV
eukprot:1509246-Heterocapsa_arctica.AAC.1